MFIGLESPSLGALAALFCLIVVARVLVHRLTRRRRFCRDLDTKLLKLTAHVYWTLRDAVCGVHAFGAIGAGKSSAFATLAAAYLRAGMGALVLCAKNDLGMWLAYAKKHGRSRDIVVFDESRGFNFLSYELARQGGAKAIGSIVDCLMQVLESADAATGITGHSSESFWPQAIREALVHCVPLIHSAWGTVTVANIVDFVTSAATKPEQYFDEAWAPGSFAARTLRKAVDAPAVPMNEAECKGFLQYWLCEWPAVPTKTMGNITISLSSKLGRFRHGRLRDCFCGKTDLVPEMCFSGSIIIMAMSPLGGWNEDGIVAQQLFKTMWQRAVESRNSLDKRQRERPIFLWCDEAQYFITRNDESFLSTCRASRACVVYLTQTLPTYYSRLGKDKTDAVDGIVGKFANQVFFSNACTRTNQFASQTIGRTVQVRANHGGSTGTNRSQGMNQGANVNRGSSSSGGTSHGSGGGSWNSSSGSSSGSGENWATNLGTGTNASTSWGATQQMDNLIEPNFFASALKTGGPANGNEVSAIWFKAGANFPAGWGLGNTLLVTFKQQ
jgi:hypothetical protein